MHAEPAAHARRSDPETSHMAARAITPRLGPVQKQVMAFARKRGRRLPWTLLDLEDFYQDHGATYRTRCNELVRLKLIRWTGEWVRYEGEKRARRLWVIAGK